MHMPMWLNVCVSSSEAINEKLSSGLSISQTKSIGPKIIQKKFTIGQKCR